MWVEVRLFATLREGRGKVLDVEVEEGSSAGKILDALGINRGDVALLLINGRDGDFDAQLDEGDILALFPPVGGG